MKNLTIFLVTVLALIATSYASKIAVNEEDLKLLWSAWKDSHYKIYYEEEEAQRLEIFKENYKKILEHNNAKNSTVTLALNHFADLTADEFKDQHLGGHDSNEQSVEVQQESNEDKRFLSSLPASVDWRTKGALTTPKQQGHCKGCWSFATTGALEALHFIKSGKLVSFSEQQLLDCNGASRGCSGGNFMNGLSYAAQHGIELESNYPFLERTGSCKYNSNKGNKVNKGQVGVRSNNANALMSAVVNQPVAVAIEATQSVFQFYKSGVITSGCSANTDHAVLVVGYTTVNGVKAFIVKNSWGPHWGESGYVYISASSSANGGKGVCGILTYPGYPTA